MKTKNRSLGQTLLKFPIFLNESYIFSDVGGWGVGTSVDIIQNR